MKGILFAFRLVICLLIYTVLLSFAHIRDGLKTENLPEDHYQSKLEDTMDLRCRIQFYKTEKNYPELIKAYRRTGHQSDEKEACMYGDSMIWAAMLSNDTGLKATAYLSAGIQHYKYKKYETAFQYYLAADSLVDKTKDEYLYYKTRYNIAQIKSYLEYYDEAIKIYEECAVYFEMNNARGYINTLHALALCSSRLGSYSHSDAYIRKGRSESKRLSISNLDGYFTQIEGINQSIRWDHKKAIFLLSESLESIRNKNDFANEAVSWFYLGVSYFGMNEIEKATECFVEVDRIFNEKEYIRSDLREAYTYLANHYKGREDFALQEYYLKQLVKADRILETQYRKLSKSVFHHYDVKEYVNSKKFNDTDSEGRNKFGFWIRVSLFSFFTLVFTVLLSGKSIFNGVKVLIPPESGRPTVKIPDDDYFINSESVKRLKRKLDEFEASGRFLKGDWTQAKLAAYFGSNVMYLNKAVQYYRKKNFSNYINDLRIDHLVKLLNENSQLRLYKSESLAREVGFSSNDRFVRAFKLRIGKTLTEYLEGFRK